LFPKCCCGDFSAISWTYIFRVGLGSTDTKETAAGQTIVHTQPVACWIITVWNLFNGARFYVYNIMERKICRTSPCEHGFYSIWIGFRIERDMTWEMTWAKDIADLTHRQIPENTIYLDSSTFLDSFCKMFLIQSIISLSFSKPKPSKTLSELVRSKWYVNYVENSSMGFFTGINDQSSHSSFVAWLGESV
jgi:hypothetical protein